MQELRPGAFVAQTNSQIVSALDQKPEVRTKMMRRHKDQGKSTFDFLRNMGYETAATEITYIGFEEDWITNTITVGTGGQAAGAAPGAAVTFALNTSSPNLDNLGNAITGTYTDFDPTGEFFYPQDNMIIMYPNDVKAKIKVTKNAANDVTITAIPLKATDTIPAAAESDQLVIITNSWAEGTFQPEAFTARIIENRNYLQIIKGKVSITGTEMNREKYWQAITDGNETNPVIYGYLSKDTLDEDYRMKSRINGMLLWGGTTDNPLITGDPALNPKGGHFQSSEGLIPYVDRTGHQNLHTVATFSEDDFYLFTRITDREMSNTDIISMQGHDYGIMVNKALKDYADNTEIAITHKYFENEYFYGINPNKMSLDFSCIELAETKYMFKKIRAFSHPKLGGAIGYTYPDTALMIPLGKGYRDISNGYNITSEMTPNFGLRYLARKTNRMMEIWETGGAGAAKNTEEDAYNLSYRCEIGGEQYVGNTMIITRPSP